MGCSAIYEYNEPKKLTKEEIEENIKEELKEKIMEEKEKMEKDLKDFQAMQELKMKDDIDKFINRQQEKIKIDLDLLEKEEQEKIDKELDGIKKERNIKILDELEKIKKEKEEKMEKELENIKNEKKEKIDEELKKADKSVIKKEVKKKVYKLITKQFEKEIENRDLNVKQLVEIYGILIKIKSKYISDIIFDYIKNENYKMNLFKYSKIWQKKLNIEIYNYQKNYFEKFGLDLTEYINDYNFELFDDLKRYKLNTKQLELYILNYLEEKFKEEKINIYHKTLKTENFFLNSLMNTEYFDKFEIEIMYSLLNKTNPKLLNNYICLFKNINSKNIKYPIINIIYDKENIDSFSYFKQINIQTSMIKKLKINIENSIFFNHFLKDFFPLLMGSNIKYMAIIIEENQFIDSKLFNLINEFESIEYLNLTGCIFLSNFILKLNNLKELIVCNSKNICFKNNVYVIQKLTIKSSQIIKPKELLKFPLLEECEIIDNEIINYLIDPLSITNLKKICCESSEFIKLSNFLLESVQIYKNTKYLSEIEKSMLQLILIMDKLQYFELSTDLDDKDFKNIIGINNALEKIKLTNMKGKFNNLLSKFPNISEFELNYKCSSNDIYQDIELNDYYKYTFNKLSVNIEFDPKLKSLNNAPNNQLNQNQLKNNFKNIFKTPLYTSFIFLTHFHFSFFNNSDIKFQFFEDLYKIIDHMPNLQYLYLFCSSKNIKKSYYNKLLKKIISKNLIYIDFHFYKDKPSYTNILLKNDIKELDPNINIFKYKKICIEKFDEEY